MTKKYVILQANGGNTPLNNSQNDLKTRKTMPRKKDGMPYEVHPTPAKGKDGRNIVYAIPASGLKKESWGRFY